MISSIIQHDGDSMSRAMASSQRIQTHLSDVSMAIHYRSAMNRVSLSPFLFDIESYKSLAVLHEALVKGVREVVLNWSTNSTLQAHLPVHPRIARLLMNAPDHHYDIGTLRPDILFDKRGSFQVCEINGRFPLNCFITGALLNNGVHHESMRRDSILAEHNVCSISSITSFLPKLKQRLVAHDNVVFLLHGREKMHDIAMVEDAMSIHVRHCSPDQLALSPCPEKGLHLKEANGSFTPIRSCIIELHQDEFLEMRDEILDALAELCFKGHAINDLRTIFLAHNKNILHLLCSDILKLDPETSAVLQKHIVPTIPAQHVTSDFHDFAPSSLLLKPGSLGKSDGILLQKNMSDEKFFEQVSSKSVESPHVVQAYVEPRTFEIVDNECNIREMTAVGIILSFDGTFYGPGLVRSSVGDVSSITGGGICSIPAMSVVNIPPCVRSFCNGLFNADMKFVSNGLTDYGLALVGSATPVHDGEVLLHFLKHGLGAKCYSHSDSGSALWEVGRKNNLTAGYESLLTSLQCEVRKKDSFEADTPRFVAISVVNADKMGGGLLSLVRIADVLKELHSDHIDVLERIKHRWEVPHEWNSCCTKALLRPVLLPSSRALFDREKVVAEQFGSEEVKQCDDAFSAFYQILQRMGKQNRFLLPEQSLIIIDNDRFAYATTEVRDVERHLHIVHFDLPGVSGEA